MIAPQKKLGEILVEKGLVTEKHITKALKTKSETGDLLGRILVSEGRVAAMKLAETLAEQPTQTAFDRGVARFTWLMLRFILVMVPLVFIINGVTKGNWGEAFFFAIAVAVGLTPEMLPMIVTVNLARGAIAMSRAKVIVKRLAAIQNFGAMDVLCTDKTGTLTEDRISLALHIDAFGDRKSTRLNSSH